MLMPHRFGGTSGLSCCEFLRCDLIDGVHHADTEQHQGDGREAQHRIILQRTGGGLYDDHAGEDGSGTAGDLLQ